MATIQVYRLGVTSVGTTTARVYRLGVTSAGTLSLRSIPDATVEPQTLVNVTAVPASGSATPTSYTWRQVSGPPVTLTTLNETASFEAPSVFPPNSGVVVIGVTGTLSGVTTAEQYATVTVLPQTSWSRPPGQTDWDGAKVVNLT